MFLESLFLYRVGPLRYASVTIFISASYMVNVATTEPANVVILLSYAFLFVLLKLANSEHQTLPVNCLSCSHEAFLSQIWEDVIEVPNSEFLYASS